MPAVVRAADLAARESASRLPYLEAVTSRHGARGVYAAHVTVRAGEKSVPHFHVNTETVIYQLTGRVKTYFGPTLADVIETGPGDFLYIGPNEVHQAVNDSDAAATGVVFRNAEHERVVEVDVPSR